MWKILTLAHNLYCTWLSTYDLTLLQLSSLLLGKVVKKPEGSLPNVTFLLEKTNYESGITAKDIWVWSKCLSPPLQQFMVRSRLINWESIFSSETELLGGEGPYYLVMGDWHWNKLLIWAETIWRLVCWLGVGINLQPPTPIYLVMPNCTKC